MDNSHKNEFEFLDYSNLDANGIDELTAILKPNAITEGLKLPWDRGENDYNELSEEIPIQEMPKPWQPYEFEEYIVKYPIQQNPSSNVFSHIPYPYNQYVTCIGQDPNICYNSAPEVGVLSYPVLSSIHMSNENQDMALVRDGGRRGRIRNNKNYSRNMTYGNEMNAGYIDNHCQYPVNMQYPLTYAYLPSIHHTQQHPATGQAYNNSMYASTFPQQTHQFDNVAYLSPNPKHSHQSQNVLPQTNGESTQITNHKIYEKKVQNVNITKPSIHQTHDDINNSSQANIVTTVIVNNSNIDSSINDIDENPTVINNSNNKNYLKIEQHTVVSKINENYKGVEKNDIPCFNVKSRIEVKQNGNDNKEYNETVSDLKTPIISMTSKPAAKSSNEEFQNKEFKDVPSTENTSEMNDVQVNTSFSNASNISWANVVKNSETHNVGSNKPMAFIAPNNVISTNNDQIETTSVDKGSSAPKSSQNKLFPVTEYVSQKCDEPLENKSLQTDTPQLHCDDPIIYRMGEFLLSYQMDKQTVSLLPRGLTNRSNYCYINSILQALLACPPFYNLLMALPYSKNPSRRSPSPLIDNMIKFAREFSPLSDGARLARKDRAQKRNEDAIVDIQSGVPFEPSYIYTILKNTSSPGVFSVEGRQEDAEEFLSCLLNGISDEMLELMKLANNNDQKSIECVDANFNYNQGEEEWKVMGPKNKGSITRSTDFGRTPLSDIFRGQLRSRVSRASEQATDYVQPFFTLQLDIEKAESVKTALEILVGKDPLEGMTCSKTKQQIEAWKQVTLEELPVILILHLKWFDYKPDGCSKILKSVEFPIDLKIDHKLISHNAKTKINVKQKQYKLFAVTYHDGKEATKGHYVTDTFHVGYGGWVRYDDSSLKGVSEANVLNPLPPRVPYLLYYRRCDTIGNNQSNVKTR